MLSYLLNPKSWSALFFQFFRGKRKVSADQVQTDMKKVLHTLPLSQQLISAMLSDLLSPKSWSALLFQFFRGERKVSADQCRPGPNRHEKSFTHSTFISATNLSDAELFAES